MTLYGSEERLVGPVIDHLVAALRAHGSVLVIATSEHHAAFEEGLARAGIDVAASVSRGQYRALDATATLDLFSVGGRIEGDRFARLLDVLLPSADQGSPVRIFDEMVTLLLRRGQPEAAAELEQRWNEHLPSGGTAQLLCAYPAEAFTPDEHAEMMAMLRQHARVVPGHALPTGATGTPNASSATAGGPSNRLGPTTLLAAADPDGSSTGHGPAAATPVLPTAIEDGDASLALGALDALDCHIAVIDEVGTLRWVNAAWTRFASQNGGSSCGVGANYFEVCEAAVDDPVAKRVLDDLRSLFDGSVDVVRTDYPCHSPDEQRWFRMVASRSTRPDPPRVVVRHELVTAERLAKTGTRLGSRLLDEVDAAVIATDLHGTILRWNRAAERLFGWSSTEALGRPLYELTVPAEVRAPAAAIIERVIAAGMWEGEFEVVHRDGSSRPAYVRNTLLRDDQGRPVGVVGVSIDISERVAMERELSRTTQRLLTITEQVGDGLCTIDPEGRIGYLNPAARQLLGPSAANVTQLGSTLADLVAALEPTSHLAADPATGEAATTVCNDETVLTRLDGTRVPIEFTATVLDPADGGGWVVVFRDISERLAREESLRRQSDHASWLARIRDGLEHDRFVLYEQPIVELATMRTVQRELLLRLDDPIEGLIPPDRFLPTAEQYGQASEIDRWVISRGLREARNGQAVEINLSAISLGNPAVLEHIERELAVAGVDPQQVVFEITETALLANDVSARLFAERVHALGCQLALDDFGTGYSSFTYLKHLPVDYLKIDMEFVQDAIDNASSRHVVSAVVALAQAFGIETVAEGVEDAATLRLLVELGVDYAQGYHLGRPTRCCPNPGGGTTRRSGARASSRRPATC